MTTQHPDADAFMRRILADPTDPLPRLILADWLDEVGGSSNQAWARYLRIGVDRARLSNDDPVTRKLARELVRLAPCIRARLSFHATAFVAYPDSWIQILPLSQMLLNVEDLYVPDAMLARLSAAMAETHQMLPLAVSGSVLYAAHESRRQDEQTDLPARWLGLDIVTVPAQPEPLRDAIERLYGPTTQPFIELAPPPRETPADDNLPIARVVELVLDDAIQQQAMIVEFVPEGDWVRVWLQFASGRRELTPLPGRLLWPLVTRIRVLASLPAGDEHPIQIGTLPYAVRGLVYSLALRIEATAFGPRVSVTLPADATVPAAALNPAA